MRRTHPTRDPWRPTSHCYACGGTGRSGVSVAGRMLPCPCCVGGRVVRPGWRIYRPRRTRWCNGLCVTGADVGVPSADVAYPHPGCPLHWGPPDEPEIPGHILAHDARCGAVTGGSCDCDEWGRFDEDRADDVDLCDCSLCAGFENCRDEYEDVLPPPGRTCCGVPGCMGGCNFWAPTEARP